MSTARVKLIIQNPFSSPLRCTAISCGTFDNMVVGSVIPPGGQLTFSSESNDRLFCTWANDGGGNYQMGMTCPIASDNSAQGSTGDEGLQTYDQDGTPVTFTYVVGRSNLASWGSGSSPDTAKIAYGECS